jgi:hypothetical protein
MTQYAEPPRVRPEPPMPVVAAERAMPRISLARRSLLDLPMASGLPLASSGAASDNGDGFADADGIDELQMDGDLNSTFDVPAFLRRQES